VTVKKSTKPKAKPKPLETKPLETKRPPAEKPIKLNMTFAEALKMIATRGQRKKAH
jgi:hypothetical protein